MSKPATRWGIASAGKISHDFVVALATLDPKEHVVQAVAARSAERAKDFAALHKIPKFYGTYEELAMDKEVDIVYIGTINTEHKWMSMMMLEHGKHVLCEKPMCMNEKDTRELCEYAKSKNLFLMEGIWSRFFPAYLDMKKQIDEGVIGEVMQINCNFGVPIVTVDRLRKAELGGGTLHDLGIYVLQLQQLFFGKNHTELLATGVLNEEGVDEQASVILKYPGGKIAVLSTNSRVMGSNTAEITGTKGFIQIPKFWCPEQLILPSGTKNFEIPPTKSSLNFMNSTGLCYEAIEIRRCILEGKLECPVVSHEDSIHLAYLRDEILKQIKK